MIKYLIIFFKTLYFHLVLRKPLYVNNFVETIPENLVPGILYIEGSLEEYWFASLLCPCGCGEVININLDKHDTPYWKLDKSEFSTLSPSLWKKNGCKSHFFLKKGVVKWC